VAIYGAESRFRAVFILEMCALKSLSGKSLQILVRYKWTVEKWAYNRRTASEIWAQDSAICSVRWGSSEKRNITISQHISISDVAQFLQAYVEILAPKWAVNDFTCVIPQA
jgi:hypothetical protein